MPYSRRTLGGYAESQTPINESRTQSRTDSTSAPQVKGNSYWVCRVLGALSEDVKIVVFKDLASRLLRSQVRCVCVCVRVCV